MTVRELIQQLLLNSPDLDSTVYITKKLTETLCKGYNITSISNRGANDAIFIELEDWSEF